MVYEGLWPCQWQSEVDSVVVCIPVAAHGTDGNPNAEADKIKTDLLERREKRGFGFRN